MFKKKLKIFDEKPFVSMIVVAAGSSSRMGENKLLMDLFGEPVLAKTLKALDTSDLVSEIVIVCRQIDIVEFSNICNDFAINKPIKIVSGGETRTHSTLNGVLACDEQAEFIGVHDGARPLITDEIINSVVECAIEHSCAIPVVAVKDTIKEVVDSVCVKSIQRDTIFAVQTPQVFKAEIIKNCTHKSVKTGYSHTDDSSCVESFGHTIHTVIGDYDNIKITTPEDISLAMLIIERRGYF